MKEVVLNNGVRMPILGYGVYQVDPREAERCVSDALSVGYRMIDTAQAYNNEEGVGNAVRKSGLQRDEVFLVSKVWISNYGYEKAKASIDDSLRRLQTDYIDLMLLHQPFCDRYGAYRALEEAYGEGKLRAIGVSNFYPDHLIDLAMNVDVRPMVNQVETHVFNQHRQDRKFMEAYVREKGWSSYDQVENAKKELEPIFDRNYALLTEKSSRIKYLERLLSAYKDYEPYIKFNKEKWELRGWKQKQYCKKHIVELAYYDTYRENLKNMIKEPDKSITPGKWKAELEKLYDQYDRIEESMSGITWDLAVIEVLRWNKFDLDRILQNETKQLVHSPSIHQDIDR